MVHPVTPHFKPFYDAFTGLSELIDMYSYISAKIDRFKAETGIHCPACCSQCCHTPATNIETSIFELLPLIINLYQTGKIDTILEKLHNCNNDSKCIFYTPEIIYADTGNCSIYPWRPLICRLFGFMWVINKQDQMVFSSCKVLKQSFNNFIEDPSVPGNSQNKLFAADFSYQCYSLNPHLSSERSSINTALLKGIQMFMMRIDYQLAETAATEMPPENPDDIPPKFPPVKKCA